MRPPSSPQSHLRFPLTRLLGSVASIRVLRILATQETAVSVAQLAKECGLTRRGVHLALESLISQQIILPLGSGRVQLFRLDPLHPLAPSLKALFEHEQERWTRLLQAVREVLRSRKDVPAAWYYGSVARGQDEPRSDFDIAVVVTSSQVDQAVEEIRQALQPVEEEFYVACSVVGISDDDVERLSQGDPWWDGMAHDARLLKGVGPGQYAASLKHKEKNV